MAGDDEKHNKTAVNVYLSPSGSTERTGRIISSLLEKKGYQIREFNLAGHQGKENEIYEEIARSSLLLVGSPVYAGKAVSPVLSFLNKLPATGDIQVLAYVTYGGVSRGDSLYQLAEALDRKGFKVLGLAEVVAEHSMMFKTKNRLGKGRPGVSDTEKLDSWIGSLSPAFESTGINTMDYSAARKLHPLGRAIQSTTFRPEFDSLLFPSAKFDPGKCDSCGACAEACPSGRLDNLPGIDESKACIHCYQCVKTCTRGAFSAPVQIMYPLLRILSRIYWGSGGPETVCYR